MSKPTAQVLRKEEGRSDWFTAKSIFIQQLEAPILAPNMLCQSRVDVIWKLRDPVSRSGGPSTKSAPEWMHHRSQRDSRRLVSISQASSARCPSMICKLLR